MEAVNDSENRVFDRNEVFAILKEWIFEFRKPKFDSGKKIKIKEKTNEWLS